MLVSFVSCLFNMRQHYPRDCLDTKCVVALLERVIQKRWRIYAAALITHANGVYNALD